VRLSIVLLGTDKLKIVALRRLEGYSTIQCHTAWNCRRTVKKKTTLTAYSTELALHPSHLHQLTQPQCPPTFTSLSLLPRPSLADEMGGGWSQIRRSDHERGFLSILLAEPILSPMEGTPLTQKSISTN